MVGPVSNQTDKAAAFDPDESFIYPGSPVARALLEGRTRPNRDAAPAFSEIQITPARTGGGNNEGRE